MGKGKITRQDHPQDQRRVDELASTYQPRGMRVLKANPRVQQLVEGEEVVVDTGSAVTRVQRVGNKLYTVATLAVL